MKFDLEKVTSSLKETGSMFSKKSGRFGKKLRRTWKKIGRTRIGGKLPLNYLCLGLVAFLLLDLILIVVAVGHAGTKKQNAAEETGDQSAKAVICTAGDVMLHSPFLSSYYYTSDGVNYDFSDIFKYIKDDYQAADYTVCTFEGVLTDNDYSGHPLFKSPASIMTALKDSGIDLCLLANNHIYDEGDAGLITTQDKMDEIGLDYLGIRRSASDKNYKVVDINGIKVGMVDYVFEMASETGAAKNINAIDVTDEGAPLIHSFNYGKLDEFYAEIEECYQGMIDDGAEFCIAYMHWGDEYQTVENENQDAMAQKMCDIGFGAVIGSHPHVIQPVDLLTSSDGSHQTLVAYAIGNHLSNQRTELMEGEANGETEDGYMLNLTLERDSEGFVSVTGATYLSTWVYRYFDGDSSLYYILPLDDIDGLPALTGLTDLDTQPAESATRTWEIINSGMAKVQAALPIAAKVEEKTEEDTKETADSK